MPGSTNIEWTDASWNPTTGCTQVSPGCAHCYAKTLTERFNGPGSFDRVVLHPERLEAPLHWKKPRRVFVNSMSDLFHEDIPPSFIDKVFAIMALTPQHTYQVLTKRPERMREYLTTRDDNGVGPFKLHPVEAAMEGICGEREWCCPGLKSWPLSNVWLGVTVENQRWADERIPILLDTPAAVRFVSAEPLLEAIDLENYILGDCLDATHDENTEWHDECLRRIDWIIVGGESGPKHRPFNPDWARDIVDQGQEYGAAVFVKQLGGARPGNKLEDLPEDLRVREYPR